MGQGLRKIGLHAEDKIEKLEFMERLSHNGLLTYLWANRNIC